MTSVADMPLALGRKPAPPDPRTLQLSAYTTADLPPVPRSVDWLRRVKTWPLYRNDQIGCCTVVTCAHLTQGWTRYAGSELVTAEPDVLAAYASVSGWNPVTGEHDDGAVMRDVLNFWRKTGVGGRTVAAYVEVDVSNHEEVRYALHTFGGLAIGIDLPLSAARQLRERRTWMPVPGETGRRGSWGGHAVRAASYSPRYLTCTTWGQTQRMSWSFWNSYVVEAYAVLSFDWLEAELGRSPSGLCLQDLLADLQRITAN